MFSQHLPLNIKIRNSCRNQRGHNPRLVIADVLALERRARARLSFEPGPPVYDGVVTEQCEGDKRCRRGKGFGPGEGGDGDDRLRYPF